MQVACAALISPLGWASEGERLFHLENRVQLKYNDNINQSSDSDTNKTDGMVIADDVTVTADRNLENGFIGLRYRTVYTAYDDRESDNTDWNHDLSVILNRILTPRVTLGLVENFIYVESPEVFAPDGTLQHQNSTYIYNTVNGTVSTLIRPLLRLDTSGRYQFIRYDEQSLSQREDYDIYAAGLTLRNQWAKETSVFTEVRYESQSYTGALDTQDGSISFPGSPEQHNVVPDRGFDTISFGAGIDRIFTQQLNGSLRGGLMQKTYSEANTDNESAPYAEASVGYAASASTRFALSAVYSLYQSSLITFVNQTRTSFALSATHDLTSKISGSVGATLIDSQYDAKDSVNTLSEATVEDGSETAYSLYARLAYSVNRSNWLEVGVNTTNLSSDYSEGFDQNIFDISWKTRL